MLMLNTSNSNKPMPFKIIIAKQHPQMFMANELPNNNLRVATSIAPYRELLDQIRPQIRYGHSSIDAMPQIGRHTVQTNTFGQTVVTMTEQGVFALLYGKCNAMFDFGMLHRSTESCYCEHIVLLNTWTHPQWSLRYRLTCKRLAGYCGIVGDIAEKSRARLSRNQRSQSSKSNRAAGP